MYVWIIAHRWMEVELPDHVTGPTLLTANGNFPKSLEGITGVSGLFDLFPSSLLFRVYTKKCQNNGEDDRNGAIICRTVD